MAVTQYMIKCLEGVIAVMATVWLSHPGIDIDLWDAQLNDAPFAISARNVEKCLRGSVQNRGEEGGSARGDTPSITPCHHTLQEPGFVLLVRDQRESMVLGLIRHSTARSFLAPL